MECLTQIINSTPTLVSFGLKSFPATSVTLTFVFNSFLVNTGKKVPVQSP